MAKKGSREGAARRRTARRKGRRSGAASRGGARQGVAAASAADAETAPGRTFDALRDAADFRDRMFESTLIEVPPALAPEKFLAREVPVLDQGREGACTGFALATVANYLLRSSDYEWNRAPVSPRMAYEMAKRYDEWEGEDYDGSSARGVMKGWHKHGLCSARAWPYSVSRRGRLTRAREEDARSRPLGAYYRVNHQDLVAMHSAIAEVGILLATAVVHEGWDQPDADGRIRRRPRELGGHAFVIVGYSGLGFWIQNSWGTDWGRNGLAHLAYDDWLAHAMDVWVARLGVPVELATAQATAVTLSAAAGAHEGISASDVRPHVVSVGNDGRPRSGGPFGTGAAAIRQILREDFPRISRGWRKRRLLLYAHGGLVGEKGAVQRVADYRQALIDAEVYPLAFIWKTDGWTTITNILRDALRRRRPEGFIDKTKEFLLNRLDDALEPLARLPGKLLWDEMKENALRSTGTRRGAARIVAEEVAGLARDPAVEIHVAGHSAGSIFLAPLVRLLTASGPISAGPMKGRQGLGLEVESCTLWAPACTMALFKETYLPSLAEDSLRRFALYTLTDKAERADHCAGVYHKSLLYLVTRAFEKRAGLPVRKHRGTPLLGMQHWIDWRKDSTVRDLVKSRRIDWVRAPNSKPDTSKDASTASHHGDFDDDEPTLRSTLHRIRERPRPTSTFVFRRSSGGLRDRRMRLQ